MYLEVYPDLVFLINFFVDLILIFLVKRVNKKNSSKSKMILAAVTGATSAAIMSIFPWMNSIIRFLLMYALTSLLMIVIAFGRLKLADFIKQWIVLNLITYFFGGFINSIYYHTNIKLWLIEIGNGNIFSNISALYVILAISTIAIVSLFVLWFLRMYQLQRPLVYDVELILEDRCVQTRGLMDTGNCLYDPICKKPVMVIEKSLIEQLLSPQFMKDMDSAMSYLEGKTDDMTTFQYRDNKVFPFSFIPYRSVGKTGILLGIRLDKVLIHTENECICNERVTVAICDNRLTSGREDYKVILHKELL